VTGDAALRVDPADVAGLAAALGSVVTDAAQAARLREAGIVRARRFSWPESARALIEAYTEARHRVAARHPAHPEPRA
jgi:glycosyltransferase involved in cell wall biosynthesis